jgi:hypothetical protein
MGAFKVKNNDELKGVFIGFIKGDEVEIYTYGKRVKLGIDDVELVEII